MRQNTILLVEDDRDLREALLETLSSLDAEVIAAADGEEALLVLQRQSVDLVCSDVNMPGINGIRLLQKIQKDHPGLPVVLMTAYGSVEHSVQAMQCGAVDYLVKPFRSEVLLQLLQRHLPCGEFQVSDEPVAESANSRQLLKMAKRVAQADVTILITGESGSGKEVLARYVHENSPRKSEPFVAINCAAIPESMLEATLFGYEKGAFTGAHMSREGKFEQAEGGTLLLDEISEMDANLQAKMLRVLQEREVERLGGKQVRKLDVRIIATSNRNLAQCVADGTFREDLFYRLSVVPLQWQPLRERRADIVPIAQRLLAKHCLKMGRIQVNLDQTAQAALEHHDWPGNVRELENTMQRALVMSEGDVIYMADLGLQNPDGSQSLLSRLAQQMSDEPATAPADEIDPGKLGSDLKQREFELILSTLRDHRGKRKRTAEVLGISARTLRYKLARMRDNGIDVDAMIAS